jgi:thiol-disulfide isomerase/thioredoxin
LKNNIAIFLISLSFGTIVSAQTISGNLALLADQPTKLEGFNGLKTYPISETICDSTGNFTIPYTKANYGIGYLNSVDNKPLFIILSGEDIEIKGEALGFAESIQVVKGQENQWFEQYAKEHPKREQALSAWLYLAKMYTIDSMFSKQQTPFRAIEGEKQRIKNEDAAFLAMLPKDSYISWYLPARKLVSSVSTVAQYRPEEIPATIAAFRALDYTDPRLYKSGLLKDAIEGHFWLIENSGRTLDTVFIEMKHSIDAMMVYLIKDNKKLNEVMEYLFNLLEKHSLFRASEYLALKVLNETSCTIDSDLAKQLESYRAMKKGNVAPDMVFKVDLVAPGYVSDLPEKLSDIKSKYTVVVFGASWCPKCTEELPQIATLYSKLKEYEVEVVYISLDEDKKIFETFVKDFPFISVCDYKKWKGTIVNDYLIFATPTMFLLDKNRQIILRPNSVNQLDAWVDWVLMQGNK